MIITGATGGIGRSVNTAAQSAGWTVLTPGRDVCDVTDDASVQHYMVSLPSPEDVAAIVHCVGGIIAGSTVENTSWADVDAMLRLNLVSTFNIVRHGMPLFKARGGGSFVAIAAQAVFHPVPQRSAYAASKAGLVALMNTVAEEGRPWGVRANTIVPSIVDTEANRAWAGDEAASGWVSPTEIASTIMHLSAPECRISGASIPMYGTIPA